MTTRQSRREEILPNVERKTKLENGKPVPLSADEQEQQKFEVFAEFFKQHLHYGKGNGKEFDFFYGLGDDFFDEATCNRILDYGKVYFKRMQEDTKSHARTPIMSVKEDAIMFERYYKILKKELVYKQREVSRANKAMAKKYPQFIERLVAYYERLREHFAEGAVDANANAI